MLITEYTYHPKDKLNWEPPPGDHMQVSVLFIGGEQLKVSSLVSTRPPPLNCLDASASTEEDANNQDKQGKR